MTDKTNVRTSKDGERVVESADSIDSTEQDQNQQKERDRAREGQIYRLEKRLLNAIGRAIDDFDLIHSGDKVLVAVSGGKDSLVLLKLLTLLQKRSPVKFTLLAMNVDHGQPGFDARPIEDFVDGLGVERRFIRQDIYAIAKAKTRPGKSLCPLCSRLRRGILYTQAWELGCDAIALGHHREDLIETLLMSALYSGALKSMPPVLTSDDGRNRIIRPMVYCCEDEIAQYARIMDMPVAPPPPCEMPDKQRARVKSLIRTLTAENPAVPGNLLNALGHVVPEHLLDRELIRRLKAVADEPSSEKQESGKAP